MQDDSAARDGFFSDGRAMWVWSEESRCGRPERGSRSHYEVRRFRRVVHVEAASQARLRVACTADSRYVLYVNGRLVGRGPAKGDVLHHFYETYDLAPYLTDGENVLAALVVDCSGVHTHGLGCNGAPASVMTDSGGFLLDGTLCDAAGRPREEVATGLGWKVQVDRAYRFQDAGNTYAAVTGYQEDLDCAALPRGWTGPGFDDSDWPEARPVLPPVRFEERRDSPDSRGLLARMIPMLEEGEPVGFQAVFAPGGGAPEAGWGDLCAGRGPLRIPPRSRATAIVDAGALTTAYPRLAFSGGAGSTLTLTYAEALRHPWGHDDVPMVGEPVDVSNVAHVAVEQATGWTFDPRGQVVGRCDRVRPDGRAHVYEPFHWRTFRFVEVAVETADEPLVLEAIEHRFTAYPYVFQADFACSDPELAAMVAPSWRTIRLCTHETFEDCPYYEQLQYAGDAQIISRIAMLCSGDARLTRQALYHFDWSRLAEGVTRSAYPTRILNVIPSWSLQWIGMVADYYHYTADLATVGDLLPGMRAVLDWFRRHTDASGLPARLPYWNHIDWCVDWDRGQPPGWDTGPTLVHCGQFLKALARVAALERACGHNHRAAALDTEAAAVAAGMNDVFWSDEAGLYYDQPEHATLSQIGNAWAVIAGAAGNAEREAMRARFPHDPALARAAFFGQFFVFRALSRLGVYERALDFLETWRTMMGYGLTTWPEDTTFWRSLCHAWSASPLYEVLTEFLGIRFTGPGRARARVAPKPCGLTWCEGAAPAPEGPLEVRWRVEDGRLDLRVDAPAGLALDLVLPSGRTEHHPARNRPHAVRSSDPLPEAIALP